MDVFKQWVCYSLVYRIDTIILNHKTDLTDVAVHEHLTLTNVHVHVQYSTCINELWTIRHPMLSWYTQKRSPDEFYRVQSKEGLLEAQTYF